MPPAAFAGSIYHNEGLVLPPSVFLVRAKTQALHLWDVKPGDILIVDRAKLPEHGSLVVAFWNKQFIVRQYQTQPVPLLIDSAGRSLPCLPNMIWGRIDQRVRNHGTDWESLLTTALQIDAGASPEFMI